MRKITSDEEDAMNGIEKSRALYRAKIVAAILTDHGLPVTPPDEADLDDVERERWAACVDIEKAMSEL